MAGGGVAFGQSLEGMAGSNPSEPVVKYGTGGRITNGVRRFAIGGDSTLGTINNSDLGANDWYDGGGDFGGGYDFGGDFGPGDNPFSFTGGANDDDVPEVIITTDRPAGTGNGIDSLDWVDPNDILNTDWTTEGDDVSEIIITTDRPTQMPIDTFTFDSSDILITDWVTETDSEDVSEIIITTDRPTQTPIDSFTFTDLDTDSWVTEMDTEDVSEIIITTDRPTTTPIVTDTFTDTDTVTWVTETDTEEPTETIIWTDPPPPTEPPTEPPPTEPPTDTIWWTDPPTLPPRTLPPRPTTTPRPTVPPVTDTPRPTTTPVPRAGIYRPQYQNYADPLTMFNVSNYGTDPATSAGYNYATAPGNMGIAQLNQNLRDLADRQMAQTYPDGSPRGADMNAVLREMRAVGLTPTDLENARYGRTTGLNTPFSQYNKQQPTARTFGGGIAELIKKLPS